MGKRFVGIYLSFLLMGEPQIRHSPSWSKYLPQPLHRYFQWTRFAFRWCMGFVCTPSTPATFWMAKSSV
jgi:hypothetical protein